jgi:small subunit ribosomal protein S10
MVVNKIRIKIKSFDHELLEVAVSNIIEALGRAGASIVGPVPLPTKIKKYTVIRSPHVDKRSREQFEIRIHKRLIDILEPNESIIEELKKLSLPSGVEVEIK